MLLHICCVLMCIGQHELALSKVDNFRHFILIQQYYIIHNKLNWNKQQSQPILALSLHQGQIEHNEIFKRSI